MADKKPGLWANIHAKRQRGESPAKPGDKDYPDAKNWKKVTSISEKKGTAAWQKSEGKNPEGGLNEKGRASLKAQGHDIKRPQPEGGARKDSFCARMKGMKSKLTSSETANDPDSRINKSLRKWKCGSFDFGNESNVSNPHIVINAFSKQANPILNRQLLGGLLGVLAGSYGPLAFGAQPNMLYTLGGGLTGMGLGAYSGYNKLKKDISKEYKKLKGKPNLTEQESRNLAVLEEDMPKGEKTANDHDSRINKSLRKWKCGSFNFEKESNVSNSQIVINAFNKRAGFNLKDIASDALHYYRGLDPTAQSAIVGSGLGAVTGGLGNALFGNRNKGFLRRLATGTLGGAALGGLGGAGLNEAILRHRMATDPDLFRDTARDVAPLPIDRLNESKSLRSLEKNLIAPKLERLRNQDYAD